MNRIALVLILCAAASAAFAEHIPVAPPLGLDLQARTQVVADIDDLNLLAEVLGRFEGADHAFGYRSATLGAYYRVLPNLKLGGFYRLQAGARHDDDWVRSEEDPLAWVWADTADRWESIVMLDASPRFLLDFLPGENWVFMLKTRVIYNTFNSDVSILARPELTYFLMVDRVPVLNATLSYQLYFPLNFGSTIVYQHYPYLSLLWHATPEVGIELSGAYRTTAWSASAEELSVHGDPYTVYASRWIVSLGAVITLTF